MVKKIDKAAIWLAGFVDGEGAIMITKIKRHDTRSQNPQYQLRLSVTNTSIEALKFIEANFGGKISKGHGTFNASRMLLKNFKPVFEWVASDKTAFSTLERIISYLVIKKERAEIAMQYHTSRAKWRAGRGVHNKLDESEISRREAIYQKMKSLNIRGIPKGE